MRHRLLFGGYFLTITLLFFYSFTQVDLSLTLSQISVWQVMQKAFQHVGYFDRPLSTIFYIAILLLLFLFYLLLISLAKKNILSRRSVWLLIIIQTLILTFSYNAFSYDLFNYIFDSKIFTHYQQNPYLHKALDYPNDPMLSFMHWTHRVYPYGPVWIVLTVPLSFLGLNYFLLTFFLFKGLISASFLGTGYFLEKIARKIEPKYALPSLVFFSFNPLVIIESLVSSHNDIVMLFFALIAAYFLLSKKYTFSFLFLFASIGIKFATVFLIPAFLFYILFQYRKKPIRPEYFFLLATCSMIIAIVLASVRTNFQPWYLLYALPFAALVSDKYFVKIPVIIFSFFALLEYIPFLYLGNWNPPIPQILFFLTLSAFLLSILVTICWRFLLDRSIQK